jgi:hypothetical protein
MYLGGEGEGKQVNDHVRQISEEEKHDDPQRCEHVVGENNVSIILTELINFLAQDKARF